MAENKRLNPDIDFQLWDDHDIDDFISKEFPPEYYKAFKSINPSLGDHFCYVLYNSFLQEQQKQISLDTVYCIKEEDYIWI